MQVFNQFADLPEVYEGCVIALGTFDGIHLGHLDIIKKAKAVAEERKVKAVVFSFSNHPLELISPEKSPARLCSEAKKKELLQGLGVDILFNMKFDSIFATVSSVDFVLTLQKYFAPSCIVVGDNYSYGYLGAGTAQTLCRDGLRYGFQVIVRGLVKIEEIVVSSTNIRRFIQAGKILTADKLLGRNYSLLGKVVTGDKRGRELGFPTANLLVPDIFALPADGVYMGFAKYAGKNYKALINIGKNPTFAGKERRIEVHLLDFEQDIYGRELEVFFVDWLRGEVAFNSKKELVAAIKSDLALAEKYLPACRC